MLSRMAWSCDASIDTAVRNAEVLLDHGCYQWMVLYPELSEECHESSLQEQVRIHTASAIQCTIPRRVIVGSYYNSYWQHSSVHDTTCVDYKRQRSLIHHHRHTDRQPIVWSPSSTILIIWCFWREVWFDHITWPVSLGWAISSFSH